MIELLLLAYVVVSIGLLLALGITLIIDENAAGVLVLGASAWPLTICLVALYVLTMLLWHLAAKARERFG